jgi:hypothetical protein
MTLSPRLTDAPLGNPALPGSLNRGVDGYDLVAGGSDIWLNADEGHFASFAHEGDFDLRVRLAAFEGTHLYAKAGVMVRESLAAGSRHLFFLAFRHDAARNRNNGGFEGQFRAETDGPCTGIYPPQPDPVPSRFPASFPNAWLRLVRRADEFQMFQGVDGVTWNRYGSVSLALPPKILLGLAATSHEPGETATARFRDLALGGLI